MIRFFEFIISSLDFITDTDNDRPWLNNIHLEITLVVSLFVLGNLVCQSVQSSKKEFPLLQFLLETIFAIFPMIVSFVTPQYMIIMFLALGMYLLVFYLQNYLQKKDENKDPESLEIPPLMIQTTDENGYRRIDSKLEMASEQDTKFSSDQLHYLTNIRATTMILCVIALYTVDCDIFPHRFRKTKRYGFSLMDIGVGCIVSSMGLSGSKKFTSEAWHPWDKYKNSFFGDLKGSLRSCLFLIILGLFRVLLLKLFGLGQDPAEYGVHWNFFFTLAVLSAVCGPMCRLLPQSLILPAGAAIGICYQLFLSFFGLDEYVLSFGETNTFLDQNRAGIFSSIGYLSIMMLSVGVGRYMFTSRKRSDTFRNWCIVILTSSILYVILKFILNIPESRRQANLTYVTMSFILLLLLGTAYLGLEIAGLIKKAPIIGEITNSNQLLVFLVANLQVGICNVLSKRIIGNPSTIYLVANTMMLMNLGFALYLRRINWRLKI